MITWDWYRWMIFICIMVGIAVIVYGIATMLMSETGLTQMRREFAFQRLSLEMIYEYEYILIEEGRYTNEYSPYPNWYSYYLLSITHNSHIYTHGSIEKVWRNPREYVAILEVVRANKEAWKRLKKAEKELGVKVWTD